MAGERVDNDTGIWSLIAVAAFGTVLCMWTTGLTFDWTSAVVPGLACLGLSGLAFFYHHGRPDARIAATLTGMAQLIAFSMVGATLSYAVASTGGPLWDDTLSRWDQAIGLDWRAYLAFVDARPALGVVYTVAYRSIELQIIVIVTVLGFGGAAWRLRAFVLAFVLAGITVILISSAMPAMAMYVYLGLRPRDFSHLAPAAAYVHVADFSGLRDGTLRVISLARAEGIITFPSFHAALGVIFALALWPVRLLRWPGLALNLMMIAATPIDGGHYGVDLIAGGAVGMLAFCMARVVNRRSLVKTEPLIPAPSKAPASESDRFSPA